MNNSNLFHDIMQLMFLLKRPKVIMFTATGRILEPTWNVGIFTPSAAVKRKTAQEENALHDYTAS